MIICGTGHRPDKLGGYGAYAKENLQLFAEASLRSLLGTDFTDRDVIISGMALGWDTALAWAAIKRAAPLWAYIPFKGQEGRWPQESQLDYNLILSCARQVKEISNPGYAVWKMQKRNEAMVNDSDVVLALWNGSDGGTANCVRYAEKVGKKVINLWSVFEQYKSQPSG